MKISGRISSYKRELVREGRGEGELLAARGAISVTPPIVGAADADPDVRSTHARLGLCEEAARPLTGISAGVAPNPIPAHLAHISADGADDDGGGSERRIPLGVDVAALRLVSS